MLKPDLAQAARYLSFLSGLPKERLHEEVFHFRAIAEGPNKPKTWQEGARNRPLHGHVVGDLQSYNISGRKHGGVFVPYGIFVGVQRFFPTWEVTGARKSALERLRVIAVDIDSPDSDWREKTAALPPHCVVRTKNGHHIYWKLDDPPGISDEAYPVLIELLADYLGGDKKAKDVARVLRVPGFFHQKDPENPFLVTLEHCEEAPTPLRPIELLTALGLYETYLERVREKFLGRSADKQPRAKTVSRSGSDGADLEDFEVDDERVLAARVRRLRKYVKKAPGLDDGRKTKAFALGGKAYDFGVSPNEALEVIETWNERNDPPLDAETLASQVFGAYRADKNDPFANDANDESAEAAAVIDAVRNYHNESLKAANKPAQESSSELKPRFSRLQRSSKLPIQNNAENWIMPPDEHGRGGTYEINICNQRYIGGSLQKVMQKFEATGAVVVLDAPMGAGKTYAVKEATRGRSLLAVTSLSSLTRANAVKLDALVYTDPEAPSAPRVSTTINSVGKMDLAPPLEGEDLGHFTRHCAFVDEAHEALDYIHQGTLDNRLQAQRDLLDRWGSAKFSIVASADWDAGNMGWWTQGAHEVLPDRPTVIVRLHREQSDRHVKVHSVASCEQQFRADVLAHKQGDAPLALFATSAKQVRVKERVIRKLRPDLRVLRVCSGNSDTPEIQELLAEPDRITSEYDIILCSPSVQSGISIEGRVKRLYVLWNYDRIVARNVGQMVMRCRNLDDPSVIVGWGVYGKAEHLKTSTEYLYKVATQTAKEARGNWNRHLPNFRTIDIRTRTAVPEDDMFTAGWILQQKVARATHNDPWSEWEKVCERHGWELTDARDVEVDEEAAKVLAAQHKEAREEEDADYAREVATAEKVDESEAKRIQESPTRTPEEKASLARHFFERFYEKEATAAEVLRDDYGRQRKRTRKYNRLLAYATQHVEEDHPERLDHLLALEDFERSGSRHDCEVQSNYRKAAVAHTLFRKVFEHEFTEEGPNDGATFYGKDIRAKLKPFVERHFTPLHEVLGWATRDESKLVAAFNALCEKHGIEHTTSRKRVDGDPQWVYTYHLTTVHEDGKAERERMRLRAKVHGGDPYAAIESA
jgi:hypothetical protein